MAKWIKRSSKEELALFEKIADELKDLVEAEGKKAPRKMKLCGTFDIIDKLFEEKK